MRRTPVAVPPPARVSILDWLHLVNWIDGTPMLHHVEPYRRAIMTTLFDSHLPDGRIRYNEALLSRGKKNWKSADLVTQSLYKLTAYDAVGGNTCFLISNDESQAGDNLRLGRRIIEVSPYLRSRVTVQAKAIVRNDGKGELSILPAQDAVGMHGKSFIFAAFDEIWAYRSWDAIEGLELDPTRLDAQRVFTSYNTIFSKRGVPLVDLIARAKDGSDPRFFCSFYSADWTTDPSASDLTPEERANPSRASWSDPDYLQQQKTRLPTARYRRLHLNLPGSPEGAALDPDSIVDAIARNMRERAPVFGTRYFVFFDMSSGQQDDSAVAVAYRDPQTGKGVLALCRRQAQTRTTSSPTFDPYKPVSEFAAVCRQYGTYMGVSDGYARGLFLTAYAKENIALELCGVSTSELFEKLQVFLNARQVEILDNAELESQLISLVWKNGKITHPNGEHDDMACACAGALALAMENADIEPDYTMTEAEQFQLWKVFHGRPGEIDLSGIPEDEIGGIF